MPTQKKYGAEVTGFVAELRSASMKMHTREQSKEGEKEAKKPEEMAVHKWEPTIEGYLQFMVDSKLVFQTLEGIVQKAAVPCYAEFRNTGLERSEKLETDLEWLKEQGYTIPKPSNPGITYSSFLEDISEKDLHAFICHFYNIYFGHSSGGQIIGKRVAEKFMDKKRLEFYKWEGDLPQLMHNVRVKLNKVAEGWSVEEKKRCVKETEASFKYSRDIFHLIVASN